jgi:hypothetical protein
MLQILQSLILNPSNNFKVFHRGHEIDPNKVPLQFMEDLSKILIQNSFLKSLNATLKSLWDPNRGLLIQGYGDDDVLTEAASYRDCSFIVNCGTFSKIRIIDMEGKSESRIKFYYEEREEIKTLLELNRQFLI